MQTNKSAQKTLTRTQKDPDAMGAIRNGAYRYPGNEQDAAVRAAHFFNWLATNYPGQPVPWTYTHKAIYGGRLLTPKDLEIRALSNKRLRINRILGTQYDRMLHHVHAMGYRASTSEDDKVLHPLEAKRQRFDTARRSFIEDHAKINPTKVKSADAKKTFQTQSSLAKGLESDNITRFLPPPREPKKTALLPAQR